MLTLAGDVQELDIKHEDGAGRDDGAHPLLPVGEVGGDDESPSLSHTHPAQASVPASDHLTHPEGELERLIPATSKFPLRSF